MDEFLVIARGARLQTLKMLYSPLLNDMFVN